MIFCTLAQLPRLVGKCDFYSLDEGTQVLTDMHSDWLSVASPVQEVYCITVYRTNMLHLEMKYWPCSAQEYYCIVLYL